MPTKLRGVFAGLAILSAATWVVPAVLLVGPVGLVLAPLGYVLYRVIIASLSPYTITINESVLVLRTGWYRVRVPFGQITSFKTIRWMGWGVNMRSNRRQYPPARADTNAVEIIRRGTQIVFSTRDPVAVCALIDASQARGKT